MRMMRRWWRAEEGVAAIEGAIVLLTFIFLIFSMMEFLYVMFAYSTVVRAAETAARYGVVHATCSVATSDIQTAVIPVTITSSSCGTTCQALGPASPVPVLTINAEYDFQSAGFFLSFLESTLPIKATVCLPYLNTLPL
jgi:Flp pilus assembly protein TadG